MNKTRKNKNNIFNGGSESSNTNNQVHEKLFEIISVITIVLAAVLEGMGQSFKDYVSKTNQPLSNSTVKEFLKSKTSGLTSGLKSTSKLATGLARDLKTNMKTGGAVVNTTDNNSAMLSNENQTVEDLSKFLISFAGKVGEYSKSGVALISKQAFLTASGMISNALYKIFPIDLIDKPYSEINPKLTVQLGRIGDNIDQFVKSPEAKAAISKLVKSVSDVGIETFEIARPRIEEMADRVWLMANRIGTKSAKSAVETGVGILSTAVSAVPILGPLSVGAITGSKIATNLIDIGSNIVTLMKNLFGNASEITGKVRLNIEKNKSRINEASTEMKNVFDNIKSKTQIPNTNVKQMVGGYAKMRKKTRARKSQIEKRLRKSLKAFFRK